MHRKHRKRAWSAALAGLLAAASNSALPLWAQDSTSMLTVPAGLQGDLHLESSPLQYVQSPHFAIPFEVDRSGRLPSEVNLWVSADRGRSWIRYATNSPDKRSFEFHAAAEGEYLFAVQTRDDRGTSALAAAPPMRILVDTTRPQVELGADLNSSGRLVISYRIAEDHLSDDEGAVKLAYALDGKDQWEEIRPGAIKRENDLWVSSIELEMPRCRELTLKIAVTDKAQNTTETFARYNAPRTAAASPGMQLASQRALGNTKAQNLGEPKTAPTTTTTTTRDRSTRIAQLGTPKPMADKNGTLQPTEGAVAWEPSPPKASSRNSAKNDSRSWTRYGAIAPDESDGSSSENKFGPSTTRRAPSKKSLGQTVSSGPDGQAQPGLQLNDEEADNDLSLQPTLAIPPAIEELPAPPAELELPVSRPAPARSLPTQSLSTQSNPAKSSELTLSGNDLPRFGDSSSPALNSIIDKMNSSSSPRTSDAVPPYTPPVKVEVPGQTTPNAPDTSPAYQHPDSSPAKTSDLMEAGTPNSQDAYHSRSRSFSLDYSVESLRGIAISDIELWGTTDRGKTWERWGSDPDRESPFDVQVGDDGVFGFRMVIIGQNGMVSNRPQDGDTADMWINVDTSMPTVKITRALYGEGEEAGMLVIDYTATDDNLHDRPISFSFSERPTGPWTTIASGQRNAGIYLWKADPKLPEQVYLRIQAVDRAGNQQEHRLELPINLRGLTPRGRIQGFRPIDPK